MCCDADADCQLGHHCNAARYYCVPDEGDAPAVSATLPPSQEEMKESAEERIEQIEKLLVELQERAPDADLSSVESLIAQANEKLASGDVAEAYRLSVEAGTTFTEAKKEVTLAIGAVCFEDAECETGNCQNKVCCKAGEMCCDKDALCKEEQRCDTERSYCVWKEEAPQSMQERILDILTDPETIVTIVAAAVVGLGFGLYQLRGRIAEKKAEERFEHMAETVEQLQQTQYYQGPGGQWEHQPRQWQSPQGGWRPPEGNGG